MQVHGSYVKNPCVVRSQEFDSIAEAEKRTGCYVSTVFQWRFGSAGKHMKKLIQTEAFGKPMVMVCNTLWYRTQDYYDVDWRGRFDNEFGGPTMTLGIHLTDFMLWLMDDWSQVSAMIGTLDHDIEVEDISMANVRFNNGAMASIVNSALSPRQETFLRMDFQKATIELTALYRYTNEHWQFSTHPDLEDEKIRAQWDALSEDYMGSHDQQLSEILDAMDNNISPPVHGDEARRIIEFNASLYKSAFTGQIVNKREHHTRRPILLFKQRRTRNDGDSPIMSIRFSAIGFAHNHIFDQVEVMLDAGAELVSYYDVESERIAIFQSRFPQGELADSIEQILEDESIQLIVSADIPNQRAPLGIRVMQHGKDYMSDKPLLPA